MYNNYVKLYKNSIIVIAAGNIVYALHRVQTLYLSNLIYYS